jgi:hypothetical protein
LRIEADVVALSHLIQRDPAVSVRSRPADGLAAGQPVELLLGDRPAVVLRVVCEASCWLAGVDR